MNIHGTITVVKNREDGNDVEETNILVVDDEKEIADLLEIYLISDGFQVLKAYSAKEGLRILEEKKIGAWTANSTAVWKLRRRYPWSAGCRSWIL